MRTPLPFQRTSLYGRFHTSYLFSGRRTCRRTSELSCPGYLSKPSSFLTCPASPRTDTTNKLSRGRERPTYATLRTDVCYIREMSGKFKTCATLAEAVVKRGYRSQPQTPTLALQHPCPNVGHCCDLTLDGDVCELLRLGSLAMTSCLTKRT